MNLDVILALSVALCVADVSAQPVRCGDIPNAIYRCLGYPRIIRGDLAVYCSTIADECKRMTCIFKKAGWLKDAGVDLNAFGSHLSRFAAEQPGWAPAARHASAACLGALPPQGAHLNCPAYDIMLCTLTSFIKHAAPSQWSTDESCKSSQQYAAACPVCPQQCFAPQIPIGSCNACLALPRSP